MKTLFGRLRAAGLAALGAGALLSVALTLYHGRRAPVWLTAMFVLWVLAPFGLLAIGERLSTRWSEPARASLYLMMLVVAMVTPVIYALVALAPPRPQGAFVFVVVPPASWVLTLVLGRLAAVLIRRTTS